MLKTGGTTRNPDASAAQRRTAGLSGGAESYGERMEPLRLTQYARGGGCACKIPAGELEQIVAGLHASAPPGSDVLVGLDDGDDAAAVRISGGQAVLSTTDFFTPLVDDPYDFGRIAAANALSDVYAMGGTPVMAINLVGWPRAALPMELLTEVLAGGLEVATTPERLELGLTSGGTLPVETERPDELRNALRRALPA